MESGVIESSLGEDETQNNPPDATTSPNIPSLPNEIIGLILTFLPTPPNSHLIASYHLPLLPNAPHLTPLKAASLVSRSFRNAAMPLLFAHPRLFIQYQDDLVASLLPLLAFLTIHNLANKVTSFVIFEDWVSDHERLPRPLVRDFWNALSATVTPDTVVVTTLPLILPYFLSAPMPSIDKNLTTVQYGSLVLERSGVWTWKKPPRLMGGSWSMELPTPWGVGGVEGMVVTRLWYTTSNGEAQTMKGSGKMRRER